MDEPLVAPSGPLVSVLIATYNCIEPLRRCIRALESSIDRETLQILTVDNGSTDGSAQIDAEFPDVTVLRLPRHFGGTKARNIGLRTAKGEYLFFLSPQIEIRPDTISALISRYSSSGAGAVCPLLHDPSGRPVPQVRPLPDPRLVAAGAKGQWPEQVPGDSTAVPYPSARALILRRQSVQGMNYLDERYGEHWFDAELAWQLRRAGKEILLDPGIPVTDHGPTGMWVPSSPNQRAVVDADRALGAAAFASKHFGVAAGLSIRMRIALAALGCVLTFQDPTYNLGRLTRIVSGQKLDGTELMPP